MKSFPGEQLLEFACELPRLAVVAVARYHGNVVRGGDLREPQPVGVAVLGCQSVQQAVEPYAVRVEVYRARPSALDLVAEPRLLGQGRAQPEDVGDLQLGAVVGRRQRHVEFLVEGFALGAALDGVTNVQRPQNSLVRSSELGVGSTCRVQVGVEGVGVLHGKLPAAHGGVARTHLVAELRPNLEQPDGQLGPRQRTEYVVCDTTYQLLAGRTQMQRSTLSVTQRTEISAELSLATLYNALRLQYWQLDLVCAQARHLNAGDTLQPS
ncbi:uncharacterized protein BcabD6B2_28790 [Babesia caballi]|uniref:Uncharacterized protein n=1 Tax=Babesia caballi TaxID=5871 RepID=A0AAV4LTV2_BABCB|nr:hypothetical protein BcabD6B2_28790 [Babesia caballi]